MGMKLGGQARQVLDNLFEKWDHNKEDNMDYEEATTHEAITGMWRAFNKRNAISGLREIHVAAGGQTPIRLDTL